MSQGENFMLHRHIQILIHRWQRWTNTVCSEARQAAESIVQGEAQTQTQTFFLDVHLAESFHLKCHIIDLYFWHQDFDE